MLNSQCGYRRLLPIVMVLIVTLGVIHLFQINYSYADVVKQGEISDNISYKVYDDDSLVISGEGAIPALEDWSCGEDDIDYLVNKIKKIVIEEGITELKRNALFCDNDWCFKKMETIEFPSTLVKVGRASIGGSINSNMALKELIFNSNSNLKEIGMNAFCGCIKLEELVIPEGVTTIDHYAFQGCTGLKQISFPSTITSYGSSVLYGCTNMEIITFNALQAAPLSQERTGQSGEGYIGFDTYIYMATNPASAEGCLRKENGHDVVMRHPVGAKGYSDDDPAPTDGWAYYSENTWETFSNLPEEVQAVIDKIDKIGEVTADNYLDKENDIIASRNAYDALGTDELKDQVTNYDSLTAAETAFNAFKLAAAKTAAISELEEAFDKTQYSGDELAKLNQAIENGKTAINAATSEDAITVAKNNALDEARKAKTDAQIAEEALQKAKELPV